LLELLEKQIGDLERKREAARRIKLEIDTIDQHFRESLTAKFIEALDEETHKNEDPISRKCSRIEEGITIKVPTRHAEKVTFDKDVEAHFQREQEKSNGAVERKSRSVIYKLANCFSDLR
jgi:transcription elongation GreA/GreB family factor